MKTFKTILASALFTSVIIAGAAQAEQRTQNELYDIIHPESAPIFNVGDYRKSVPAGIVSLHDDHNETSVWSYEFEQYVDPNDFNHTELISTEDINHYMGKNPTAAGPNKHNVFIYNETAHEYHLQ